MMATTLATVWLPSCFKLMLFVRSLQRLHLLRCYAIICTAHCIIYYFLVCITISFFPKLKLDCEIIMDAQEVAK